MLSMPADLVLNLIYGNAACSTYFCLLNATPQHSTPQHLLFDSYSRKVCLQLGQLADAPIANCHRHGSLLFVRIVWFLGSKTGHGIAYTTCSFCCLTGRWSPVDVFSALVTMFHVPCSLLSAQNYQLTVTSFPHPLHLHFSFLCCCFIHLISCLAAVQRIYSIYFYCLDAVFEALANCHCTNSIKWWHRRSCLRACVIEVLIIEQ